MFKNYRGFLWIVFKWVLTVGALLLIGRELRNKEHIDGVAAIISGLKNNNHKLQLLAVVVLFMPLNWAVESYKWLLLVRRFTPLNFLISYRAIFTGITFSLFTPNRVGEFIGRVMHVEPGARIRAALVTLICSFAQLITTIILGSISAFICMDKFITLEPSTKWLIAVGLFISLTGVLLLYFRIKLFERYILKWKWTQPAKKYLEAFELYSPKDLTQILLLSVFRFFVYVTQLVLILILLDVNFGIIQMYPPAMLSFLVITIIPSFAITEPAMRASVAATLFGVYSDNSYNIIISSVLLWFINLVIPAVIGSFMILYIRFKGKEAKEISSPTS